MEIKMIFEHKKEIQPTNRQDFIEISECIRRAPKMFLRNKTGIDLWIK